MKWIIIAHIDYCLCSGARSIFLSRE